MMKNQNKKQQKGTPSPSAEMFGVDDLKPLTN